MTIPLALLTLAAGLMLAISPASAQPGQTIEPPNPTVQSTLPEQVPPVRRDFPNQQLRQFQTVQAAIQGIRNDYLALIKVADSPEQAQQLRQEAYDLLVSAIAASGLDIPTYNAIATAYYRDAGMRERINALE